MSQPKRFPRNVAIDSIFLALKHLANLRGNPANVNFINSRVIPVCAHRCRTVAHDAWEICGVPWSSNRARVSGPQLPVMVNELADPDGFGTDTVGIMMAKYDTDGSGSFNIQEYVPLARTNAIPPDSMDRPTALHCTGYAR